MDNDNYTTISDNTDNDVEGISLLSLPISILNIVLIQCLGSISSLVCLDTAYCNHSKRKRLMNVFNDQYMAFDNVTLNGMNKNIGHAMLWIGKRRLRITSMSIIGISNEASTLTDCNLTNLLNNIYSIELKSLDLSHCDQITDIALIKIIERCPNLQSLNITRCEKITDASMFALAYYNNMTLQSLTISKCGNITDNGALEIIRSCPNLTDLNVSQCIGITNETMFHLANHCTNIISLNISWCWYISDVGMDEVSSNCTKLQVLNISKCWNISEDSMIKIFMNCPNIQSLDICWCHELTNKGMDTIAIHCHNLKSLDIGWCYRITDTSMINVANRCKHLQVIKFSENNKLKERCIQELCRLIPYVLEYQYQ